MAAIFVRTGLIEGRSTGIKTTLIWTNDTTGVLKESNRGPADPVPGDDPGDEFLGRALVAAGTRLAARKDIMAINLRQGEVVI